MNSEFQAIRAMDAGPEAETVQGTDVFVLFPDGGGGLGHVAEIDDEIGALVDKAPEPFPQIRFGAFARAARILPGKGAVKVGEHSESNGHDGLPF